MKLNLTLKEEVIDKITKITPKTGDVIVIKVKKNTSRYTQLQLHEVLSEMLPERNWFITDAELQVDTLTEAQKQELIKMLTQYDPKEQ